MHDLLRGQSSPTRVAGDLGGGDVLADEVYISGEGSSYKWQKGWGGPASCVFKQYELENPVSRDLSFR